MGVKKLFITGATGYIGGSVLEALLKEHGSNLEVSALLRSPSQEFASRYSSVNIIKGSFDDFDIIENAASESDIIIRE